MQKNLIDIHWMCRKASERRTYLLRTFIKLSTLKLKILTLIFYHSIGIFSIHYLTVSAEPLSPPTVEHLIAIGVFFPMVEKTLALQYLVISCVTSK